LRLEPEGQELIIYIQRDIGEASREASVEESRAAEEIVAGGWWKKIGIDGNLLVVSRFGL
jgi:hypothetical protein